MTNSELLAEVRTAISAILTGGQSYKIGSRTLTRANLTELKNLKSELEAAVAAENDSGSLLDGTYVAYFDTR